MANKKYFKLRTRKGGKFVSLNRLSNFQLQKIVSGEMKLIPENDPERRPLKGEAGFMSTFREQAREILEARGAEEV